MTPLSSGLPRDELHLPRIFEFASLRDVFSAAQPFSLCFPNSDTKSRDTDSSRPENHTASGTTAQAPCSRLRFDGIRNFPWERNRYSPRWFTALTRNKSMVVGPSMVW